MSDNQMIIDLDQASIEEIQTQIDELQKELDDKIKNRNNRKTKHKAKQIFDTIKNDLDGFIGLTKNFKEHKMTINHDVCFHRKTKIILSTYGDLHLETGVTLQDIDNLVHKEPIIGQGRQLEDRFKSIMNIVHKELNQNVINLVCRDILSYFNNHVN